MKHAGPASTDTARMLSELAAGNFLFAKMSLDALSSRGDVFLF